MDVRLLAALVLAGCSGKAKVVEDAKSAGDARADAAALAPLGPYKVDTDPKAKVGDVQIRVEWKNVPIDARKPERTSCGTPRAPQVSPTVTWGVPDVFVAIEVGHGKALSPPRARIALDPCALTPRVAIAGSLVAIASNVEAPATVELVKHAVLPLGNAAIAPSPTKIYLPVVGHEVEASIEAATIYKITAKESEPAYVVAAPSPYYAITEATGQVVLRDVPVGTHAVRAWLPERGKQAARTASGSVTVAEGALAEVTLDLTTQ